MSNTFITGDCHSNYDKFCKKNFPIQKELTHDDVMIVCGDFGLWHFNTSEDYCLNELNNRSFTTLFCDGNHENFDRLYTEEYKKYINGDDITGADQGEFPLVDMFGGKVQKIRDNIYHLIRGEVYTINGKKFFVFGGASSHDISDGILDRANFKSDDDYYEAAYLWRKTRTDYRIAHESWWKEELPSAAEMAHGLANLEKHDFNVDYIISHCAPSSVHIQMGYPDSDTCTEYLQKVAEITTFKKWFFGHYHEDRNIDDKFSVMYHSICMIDEYDDR